MKKVNIANYVIYDLANKFSNIKHSDVDSDIVDMVAENWHKKHFISAPNEAKHHHAEHIRQKFVI